MIAIAFHSMLAFHHTARFIEVLAVFTVGKELSPDLINKYECTIDQELMVVAVCSRGSRFVFTRERTSWPPF